MLDDQLCDVQTSLYVFSCFEGCRYNNMDFSDGETFLPEEDPCAVCTCSVS